MCPGVSRQGVQGAAPDPGGGSADGRPRRVRGCVRERSRVPATSGGGGTPWSFIGMDSYVTALSPRGRDVCVRISPSKKKKVLVEKLLYSCPKVDKVFILLRDKNNVSAEQRLQKIINLPMFCRLREERPQDLGKIVLVKGDINEPNLSMENEDLETVIEKVSVVIHSAATIKFNEPLKIVLNTNLEGTRNVLNLCHLMKNLRAFVHVSTAFCNTDQAVLKEMVYPPPVSFEEAYKFADEEPGEAEMVQFLHGRPNTYTFSKALAEHLISETHGDIPAVIIRPSIVTPSKDEPVKGWVDNWYGATGLITAVVKGICRVVYSSDDHILDMIPVDYVCNLTLVAAARAERKSEVAVYNSCSGSSNPITMKHLTNLCCEAGVKNNINELPFPAAMLFTRRHWLVRLITLLMYLVAYIADILIRISGNRPKITKLVSQIIMVRDTLEYFTSNFWLMRADKTEALHESLSPADARQFPFLARDIVWTEYMPIYIQGIKNYLLQK